MRDTGEFAPPIRKLAESGIGNTVDPAGGQGLTLTADGRIPDKLVSTESIKDGTITASDVSTGTFLELLVGGSSRKVAFGSATITWAGGTPVGGTAVITHGFASQPFMVAVSTTTNGGLATATYVGAVTATTTTLNAYAQGGNPPAGNVATVYWIAIT